MPATDYNYYAWHHFCECAEFGCREECVYDQCVVDWLWYYVLFPPGHVHKKADEDAVIFSPVQMARIKLFGESYPGTDLLNVVGTGFAMLNTANAVRTCTTCSESPNTNTTSRSQISNIMYTDGIRPSATAADGAETRGSCLDAYRMILGALLRVLYSYVPEDDRTQGRG